MRDEPPQAMNPLSKLPDHAQLRLLDAAPDALIVVNPAGIMCLVNVQAENLFGYAREELLGKAIEMLIPEHLRRGHVARRADYTAAPSLRAMGSGRELLGRRKDGSEFPVEISLSPLETDQGLFVSSAIRDISDRKRMETQAKVATQRLLSAVESIEGMFALFDAEDRLVLCNSDFRQFFARAGQGPLVGMHFRDILAEDLLREGFELGDETCGAFRERWLRHHRDPGGMLDLTTKDGLSLRVADRKTAEGGNVTTIWNITNDVKRAEELRQARAQAEAASAAKSEFLSSMSHELRTPLNSILGFAQLLQRDKRTPLTERQHEKLGHILKGGEHLLRLIDDVLDLSRIEAGRVTISLEPVSVGDVLAEVNATLGPLAARAEVALEMIVPATEQRVLADRTRFSQVLMNFGSNAIKYGQSGGTVKFVVSSPSPELSRISVIDRGQGIPLDKQVKLFQPFQRAGQELGPIEGTGIGLTISRRLAELMGGHVGFHSVPGEGSEFWVELRAYRENARVAQQETAQRPSPRSLTSAQGKRYTVVYVEDNPSNIAFMQELMEEFEGVQLITAPTAEIGMELIRERKPDVVIMDINLPGMTGIEAARRLRSWPETHAIPVIALSAAALMSERQRSEASVFFRYLTKPVKVDELVAALDETLPREG